MDSPVRRSGIPIPKTKPSPMKKNMSRSSDDLLSNSIGPQSLNTELDVFTLLEENIALKENQDNLIAKNNLILQKNVQLERENGRVGQQLNDLKIQQKQLKDQLEHLMDKFQKEIEDSQTIHNIQEQQKKTIKELMIKVRQQEEKHGDLLKAGKQAKHRLEELAPGIQLMENKNDDESKCDIVTADTVEQLINEISKIKTQMNTTELQLYEANEKIAELIDNQQHLKDENESLKVENSNLTKVAKLMTNSMRESMDTSKRMEGALIEMKRRNNELVNGNRDSIDSPTSPKFFSANDQVLHLKDELKRREAAHSERIVEMCKLMEATIETNNNDEIKILRIKLDVIEKELQLAINRAEKAENELEQLKQSIRTDKMIENTEMAHDKRLQSQTSNISTMNCTKCGQSLNESIESTSSARASITSVENEKPPPIPPPMPNFNIAPIRCGSSLSKSIAEFTLNNTTNSQGLQPKKPATGMDALILELNAELRNGRATLRRNRRTPGSNVALQEMFQTLELSNKQNRNSRILMESHMQ